MPNPVKVRKWPMLHIEWQLHHGKQRPFQPNGCHHMIIPAEWYCIITLQVWHMRGDDEIYLLCEKCANERGYTRVKGVVNASPLTRKINNNTRQIVWDVKKGLLPK
jgi:hypothetical protein